MRRWPSPKSKRWAAWFTAAIATLRFIDWLVGKIGYLGIFTSPEDFRTMMERAPVWLQAIGDAVAPAVIATFRWLDAAWGFFVSPVGTTVAFAIVAFVLAVDMNWLTRVTRGLWFKVRHSMAEQVWIGHEAALRLLRESEWGQLKAPGQGYFNALVPIIGPRTGLSDSDKIKMQFSLFLSQTLRAFAAANPTAYRNDPDEPDLYYDEVALRAFLDKAVDQIVEKQFGKPPDFKVT